MREESMTVDYAELERESYGQAPTDIRLTPEILGRALYYAWQVYRRDDTHLFSFGDLCNVLLDQLSEPSAAIPPTIASILHVEHRIDGTHIEETTPMVVAAQTPGAIGRINPANRTGIVKTDGVQAQAMVDYYELRFPQEMKWLRHIIVKAGASQTN